MEYEREDFDQPVSDYNLSQTNTVSELFEQMKNAGGFTATKLVEARDILRVAIDETKGEKNSKNLQIKNYY